MGLSHVQVIALPISHWYMEHGKEQLPQRPAYLQLRINQDAELLALERRGEAAAPGSAHWEPQVPAADTCPSSSAALTEALSETRAADQLLATPPDAFARSCAASSAAHFEAGRSSA